MGDECLYTKHIAGKWFIIYCILFRSPLCKKLLKENYLLWLYIRDDHELFLCKAYELFKVNRGTFANKNWRCYTAWGIHTEQRPTLWPKNTTMEIVFAHISTLTIHSSDIITVILSPFRADCGSMLTGMSQTLFRTFTNICCGVSFF